MKSYNEFIKEHKTERSKFIITNEKFIENSYKRVYNKDTTILAHNIYLSNNLTINERREFDYYLYLTNQTFDDAFTNFYNNGEIVTEGLGSVLNVFKKGLNYLKDGTLNAAKTISDASKNILNKVLKGVKSILEFGEKLYDNFIEGFTVIIEKVSNFAKNTFEIKDEELGENKESMFEENESDSSNQLFVKKSLKYVYDKVAENENYIKLLFKGGKSLFELLKTFVKNIANKLKKIFTDLFSQEKIFENVDLETINNYQRLEIINEKLSGNFWDNLTDKIKTIPFINTCMEFAKTIEEGFGKIIKKIEGYLINVIKSFTTRDMTDARNPGMSEKINFSSKNELLLESWVNAKNDFANGAVMPLMLSLDLLQIYAVIKINKWKGTDKQEKIKNILLNIKDGSLTDAAIEGCKGILTSSWKVGKGAFKAIFPWVGPVIKTISTIYTLWSLWKKLEPIIKKGMDAVTGKKEETTQETPTPTQPVQGQEPQVQPVQGQETTQEQPPTT